MDAVSQTRPIPQDEFAEATDAAVLSLPGSWTLDREVSSGYVRRYRTRRAQLGVAYDASRSQELNVSVMRLGGVEEFDLAEVLRATDCPAEDVARAECLAPTSLKTLQESLQVAVQLLGTWAPDFLAGRRRAYRRAMKLVEEDSLTYTAQFEGESTDSARERRSES